MRHVNANLEAIPPRPYTYQGISHPASIFRLWTRAEKLAVGIYEVVSDPVPHDKEIVASILEMQEGHVAEQHTLRDKTDPVPEEVEGWQAEVAMRATPVDSDDPGGQSVWDRVQDLIAAMPDGIEKISAQTVLSRGKIRRDSPMLAQLSPLVPLSVERVEDILRMAGGLQA